VASYVSVYLSSNGWCRDAGHPKGLEVKVARQALQCFKTGAGTDEPTAAVENHCECPTINFKLLDDNPLFTLPQANADRFTACFMVTCILHEMQCSTLNACTLPVLSAMIKSSVHAQLQSGIIT